MGIQFYHESVWYIFFALNISMVKRNIMFFLSQKKNSQPFHFRIAVLCTLFSESFTHPPENNKNLPEGNIGNRGRKTFLDLSQRRWRLPGTWKPPNESTKLKKGNSSHNGSMGLVNLPTWMVDFYDKCSKIYYTSPMDPMGMTFLFFWEPTKNQCIYLWGSIVVVVFWATHTLRGANLWCPSAPNVWNIYLHGWII